MSDINEAATVAFSEYITSCTVIVTSDDDGFDHGSGVAVQYKGKEYILTAAHVLKPLQDHRKLKFIGRPSVPFKNVTFNQLPGFRDKMNSSFGLPEAVSVHISKCIYGAPDEDVAAIEVENAHDSLPQTIFHNLSEHESIQPLAGTLASAFGFPGEIATHFTHEITGHRGVMARSLHIDVNVKDISVAPNRLNPAVNFITDYTFKESGCNPKGMSGCGIWSRPKRSIGLVWSPYTTRLLGIQSSFYPKSKLLVAVKIERVMNILSQR
jgi:hypothetical protein